MKKTLTTLAKFCSVFAVIVCAVTVLPLLAVVGLGVVALFVLIVCAAMFLVGIILWLCTVGKVDILSTASKLAEFAMAFNRVVPLANFWFDHVVPITSWVGIGLAVAGLVLWVLVLFRPVAPVLAPTVPAQIEDNGLEDYVHVEPIPKTPEEKSKKQKKQKSDRSRALPFLILCVCAILLSAAALVVAGYNIRF